MAAAKNGPGAGKVSGKTTGVSKDLLRFLQEVADHYGVTLKVTVGKTRSKPMAEEMLQKWGPEVWKQPEFPLLGIKKADLGEWMEMYNKAIVQGDSRAAKEFVHQMEGRIVSFTGHPDGEAVDLEKSTPAKVRAALRTGLWEFSHAKGHHYSMINGKPPKVTDRLKAKWKK